MSIKKIGIIISILTGVITILGAIFWMGHFIGKQGANVQNLQEKIIVLNEKIKVLDKQIKDREQKNIQLKNEIQKNEQTLRELDDKVSAAIVREINRTNGRTIDK